MKHPKIFTVECPKCGRRTKVPLELHGDVRAICKYARMQIKKIDKDAFYYECRSGKCS